MNNRVVLESFADLKDHELTLWGVVPAHQDMKATLVVRGDPIGYVQAARLQKRSAQIRIATSISGEKYSRGGPRGRLCCIRCQRCDALRCSRHKSLDDLLRHFDLDFTQHRDFPCRGINCVRQRIVAPLRGFERARCHDLPRRKVHDAK